MNIRLTWHILITSFFLIFCRCNFALQAQSLDPPTNVTAVQENQAIRLQWDAPEENSTHNRPVISYNTSTEVDTLCMTNQGLASGVQYVLTGARFSWNNFSAHVGRKVKSVEIHVQDSNNLCTFKLQIYLSTAGYSWSTASKVYEQPFVPASDGENTIIDLSNDYSIANFYLNAGYYAFGFKVERPADYFPKYGMAAGVGGYTNNTPGDMIGVFQNATQASPAYWGYLSQQSGYGGVNRNFIFKVTLGEKYNVYRDGELIATVFDPTFLDTSVQLNQNYCYTVKTVFSNSLSIASNEACCTREASFQAPEHFNYSVSQCLPNLNWSPINEAENDGTFVNYRIYKNENLIGSTTDTVFTDNDANLGTSNYCISATYLFENQIHESETTCQPVTMTAPEITILGNSNICQNDFATLTAVSSESNFLWSNGSTDSAITVAPDVTTMYTVTTYNASGCASTDSFTLHVFDHPNITLTPNSDLCLGESIQLHALGGIRYLWNTGDTTNSITVSPLTTTTYYVTIFNEWNCFSTDSVTITVHAPPNITITSDTAICYSESIILSAEGDGTLIWDNGYTEHQMIVTPLETTTYYATITNSYNCATVDSVTVFVDPLPEITISGDTLLCFNETTTLSATGGNSYLWSNGSTDDSMTVTPSETTTYSVIATNEFNCSTTIWITVTVIQPFETTIIGDSTLCLGSTATLTASGGTTYLWNNGNTNAEITVNPTEATTYHVISNDSFGCSSEQSFTVHVLEIPDFSITGDTSICAGDTTALTAQGNYLFLWNDGSTDATISISPDQTTSYTVIATNENQCSDTANMVVYVHELPIVTITGDDSICYAENTVLTASGADYYLWDDGSTQSSIVVVPTQSTVYNTIGTTLFGCSASQEFNVAVLPLPVAHYIISGNSEVCQESVQEYSIDIENAVSYFWSVPEGVAITSGQGSSSITAHITNSAQSGNISVYGINDCGNSDTVHLEVTVNSCSINISGSFQVCAQSIHTYSVPADYNNYVWEITGGVILNGDSTETIEVQWGNSEAGMITVDYDGAASTSQNIIIYALPDISITGNNEICVGMSTTLIADGGIDYLWNNEATTAEITVSPDTTTTYYVIVSNAFGCLSSDSITINVHTLPDGSIEGNNSICFGDSTLLTAVASHEIAACAWDSGDSTLSVVVSPTVTTDYSVFITDIHGCSITASLSVVVHPLPTISIAGDTAICFGESTVLNATASSEGTYLWSNGETSTEIEISPEETTIYSVLFTDENGCTATAETTVIVHPLPTISIAGDTAICFGESTVLNVTASSEGTYLWSDGETSAEIEISPTETTIYTVLFTDENGCTSVAETTVIVHPLPNISIAGDSSICFGESVVLNATASSEGTYLWNNGETSIEIEISPIETTIYSVIFTDENGCTATVETTVIVHPLPTISIAGDTAICLGESTVLNATTSSEGTYLWNNGETSAEIEISPEETTIYSVLFTDENGCTSVAETTVIVHPLPNISIAGDSSICFGESTVLNATASSEGTYLWSNGETSTEIEISPEETTIYSVLFTDENGCTATAETTIIVHPLPTISIASDTAICFGESTVLNATASSEGTYLWNNGETSAAIEISPTETTNYSVLFTDENGCAATAETTVIVHPLPNISIAGDTAICFGESTVLNATASSEGTYLWNNGDTSAEIEISPEETTIYSVLFTDENGCAATAETTVIVHPLPTISIAGDLEICLGETTELTASVTGSLPIIYLWNTGATTENITVVPQESTEYSVEVTDYNGCEQNQSAIVEVIFIDTPDNLLVNGFSESIQLQWDANNEAEYYHIFRDSQWLTSTAENIFIDDDVVPYIQYCYQVVAAAADCESEKTDEQCASTGENNEYQNGSYSIHPNPANQYFVIQGKGIVEVAIVNASGQLVYFQKNDFSDQITIDAQYLESGFYAVRLYLQNGETITRRIVIAK